jgi:hypothetical protein
LTGNRMIKLDTNPESQIVCHSGRALPIPSPGRVSLTRSSRRIRANRLTVPFRHYAVHTTTPVYGPYSPCSAHPSSSPYTCDTNSVVPPSIASPRFKTRLYAGTIRSCLWSSTASMWIRRERRGQRYLCWPRRRHEQQTGSSCNSLKPITCEKTVCDATASSPNRVQTPNCDKRPRG